MTSGPSDRVPPTGGGRGTGSGAHPVPPRPGPGRGQSERLSTTTPSPDRDGVPRPATGTGSQLLEVDCPRCRQTHVLGIPAGMTTVHAWCPRSARTYEVTIEEATATTST